MTFLAATSDSLNDLKARRDDLVRLRTQQVPDKSRELLREREAHAAREFVTWFTTQHKSGGISMPTENVMDVQPSLSRQFCIGLHDLRYFIGIPKECMSWFLDLPWLFAEVNPNSSWLSLRCRKLQAPGLTLPAFSLNFDVQPPGYTMALVHYHFLDVRAIDQIPVEGGAFQISREVYMTLDIRVSQASGSLRAAYDLRGDADMRVRLGSGSRSASR